MCLFTTKNQHFPRCMYLARVIMHECRISETCWCIPLDSLGLNYFFNFFSVNNLASDKYVCNIVLQFIVFDLTWDCLI